MQTYRKRGKIEALKAAKKAAYLTESLGKQLGNVIRIVKPQESINDYTLSAQSNMISNRTAIKNEMPQPVRNSKNRE